MGAALDNIGLYLRVTFPVCADGLSYSFFIPNVFDHGGVVIMDG